MIANPFARKPKRPVDRALDAIDGVRADAAAYAAAIRDAAADVAETLAESDRSGTRRRLPLIAAGAAVAVGLAYVLRSRIGNPAPGPPGVPGSSSGREVEEPKDDPAATAESKSAAERGFKPPADEVAAAKKA
ncbi:MAG TPA: hypothetical protein VFH44_00455 [Solirubrobacterales bacterium]|nr:hypothetical protein [Solirubrobacterales bacterium]